MKFNLQFFGGRGSSSSKGNGTTRAQGMSESELRGYIKRNNLKRAYNMTVNNMGSLSYSNQMKAMRLVVADSIDKNIQRSNKNK